MSRTDENRQTPPIRLSLDHIALAVKDLTGTLEQLAKVFTAPPAPAEEVPEEGVRLAFVDAGGTRLEVLESVRPDSAIARFLERRPPGLHHLSFEVEGLPIEEWYEELRRRGARVLGDGPRRGAGGKLVFFVHPDSTGGILVEFSQARKEPAQ
ncbi:MAG: methylmalonyl-CoA epimerase [Planctomycetes bacterium]|nr:methylmalonyl-CoA epimerase [Planctomycetota bacterium]